MSDDMREAFERRFPAPWGVEWYNADNRYAIASDDDALWDSDSPDREAALEHMSRWEGFCAAWQSQQAQGESEPVAWRMISDDRCQLRHYYLKSEAESDAERFNGVVEPLYTHLPAPAAVPELKRVGKSSDWVQGWNDCVRSMQSAAPAPAEPGAASAGLTMDHLEFLKLVCISPGSKLNGGEALKWIDDGSEYGVTLSLWKIPEEMGLIKCVGSYKWIPTDRVSLSVCIDGAAVEVSPK